MPKSKVANVRPAVAATWAGSQAGTGPIRPGCPPSRAAQPAPSSTEQLGWRGGAAEAGSAAGVPMGATSAAFGTYAAASAAGLGAEDSVAVIRFLAEKLTREQGP